MYRQKIRLLLLAALIAPPAFALPEDREQPLELDADSATLDQRTGISVYSGNVQISQGSMKLSAGEVTVGVANNAIRSLEAIGGPVKFRYRPDAEKPEVQGSGTRIEYDVVAQTVVFSGDAKLTQGGDTFTGERIVYNLKTDVLNAEGGTNGRIKIILQPANR